jgi:hypothetical protein
VKSNVAGVSDREAGLFLAMEIAVTEAYSKLRTSVAALMSEHGEDPKEDRLLALRTGQAAYSLRSQAERRQRELASKAMTQASACLCYYSCGDDPEEGCSLSGGFHVHPGEACPVHPDAPGDR